MELSLTQLSLETFSSQEVFQWLQMNHCLLHPVSVSLLMGTTARWAPPLFTLEVDLDSTVDNLGPFFCAPQTETVVAINIRQFIHDFMAHRQNACQTKCSFTTLNVCSTDKFHPEILMMRLPTCKGSKIPCKLFCVWKVGNFAETVNCSLLQAWPHVGARTHDCVPLMAKD